MKGKFILSCESTVDLPYEYITSRDIPVLFYTYTIDGKEYYDDMERDPSAREFFFDQIKQGKLPATSQINEFRYADFFEELLKDGDVLHIALGTGMTPSAKNACEAAKKLKEKYNLIPFCSEVLGGLPTPRIPAEIRGNKIINQIELDVTSYIPEDYIDELPSSRNEFKGQFTIFESDPNNEGNRIARTYDVIPEGYYFLMGDNRNNSEDSRSTSVGAILRSQIIGKAWFALPSENGSMKPIK